MEENYEINTEQSGYAILKVIDQIQVWGEHLTSGTISLRGGYSGEEVR